jgi:hypothetical protein
VALKAHPSPERVASRPHRLEPRIGLAWAVLGATIAAGALCVLLALHPKGACYKVLRSRPVPGDWHDWPELPGLGGFRIVGGSGGSLRGPAVLIEDGVCADDGLVLGPSWGFTLSPEQSRVRRRPGRVNEYVVVVKFLGRGPMSYSRDVVLGFRRSPPFVLWPRDVPAVLAIHLAAIAAMWGAIAFARKKLRLASELRDPARFAEGIRLADGQMRIGASVVNAQPGAPGAAGPVLVRIVGATAGEYRTPPSLRVSDVVSGTRDAAVRRVDRLASAALASTFLSFGCLVLAMALLASTGR